MVLPIQPHSLRLRPRLQTLNELCVHHKVDGPSACRTCNTSRCTTIQLLRLEQSNAKQIALNNRTIQTPRTQAHNVRGSDIISNASMRQASSVSLSCTRVCLLASLYALKMTARMRARRTKYDMRVHMLTMMKTKDWPLMSNRA